MSTTPNEIEALREEEKRLLDKFESRAARLQQEDPRLTHSTAYARACLEMKNCSKSYTLLREKLIAAGMLPRLIR